MGRFLKLRDELDPSGTFLSGFLERLLYGG
jgi:hypothetical protein